MSLLISCLAGVSSALAVWLVRGALAVQSASPGAPKVGVLPAVWELIALTAIAVGLVLLIRPSRDRVMPLFITALCIVPWLPGVSTPALLAWTGPLGAAVLLAAAVATILPWVRDRVRTLGAGAFANPRRAPLLAAALSFVFFSLIAYGARDIVPGGDEPHYLIITQSLLRDHDLRIENNHARGDYAAYFRGVLRPDFLARGRNGEIYSVHAPGLPVLIAPAFALAGYRGVVIFLLVCGAAGIALAWHVAYLMTRSAPAAWYGAVAVAVATPVAFHAFSVYPDGVAAVVVLSAVRALVRIVPALGERPGRATTWILHGAALAVLPWLHSRYALLSGALALVILLRMPRTREGLRRVLAFLAVPVVSAIAWFAFFYAIYGTPNPNAAYGNLLTAQGAFAFITGGVTGLFFDQQFGLLLYAPVFAIAAAGFVALIRRWPRLGVELGGVCLLYFMSVSYHRMWWGGWSAPARFAVPLLLQGAFLSALGWQAARTRAARATAIGAVLVSAFTTTALALVDGARLAYNVRDGYSLWLEWLSPLADLPLGFPSFFRSYQVEWAMDLQVLTALAPFIAAFAVLRWADRRLHPERGTFALMGLAANAIAGMVTLSVLWGVNHASGIRPTASQVQLLRVAADRPGRGVIYERGMHFVAGDAAVSTLRIASPPRMLGGSDAPALAIPGWVPAGDYTIDLSAADPAAPSNFEIRTMRLDRPIMAAVFTGHARVPLQLPADVPAIVVRGRNLAPASVTPNRVTGRAGALAHARATTGQRYDGVICWFLDTNAFIEEAGFWVRGTQSTDVVFQPLDPSARQVAIAGRNGAAPNHVRFEAGKWHEDVALAPGQPFQVSVPLDAAGAACRIRITSPAAFRPSEVERGSTDRRLLGIWISPR